MIKNGLNNRKIASFGFGRIKITSAYIDEKGMLGLDSHSAMPIGYSESSEKTPSQRIDEVINSEILLEFKEVKSIEVLILKLQEVRAMMLGCDLTVIEEWKRNHNITEVYQPNSIIDGNLPKEDEDEQL